MWQNMFDPHLLLLILEILEPYLHPQVAPRVGIEQYDTQENQECIHRHWQDAEKSRQRYWRATAEMKNVRSSLNLDLGLSLSHLLRLRSECSPPTSLLLRSIGQEHSVALPEN